MTTLYNRRRSARSLRIQLRADDDVESGADSPDSPDKKPDSPKSPDTPKSSIAPAAAAPTAAQETTAAPAAATAVEQPTPSAAPATVEQPTPEAASSAAPASVNEPAPSAPAEPAPSAAPSSAPEAPAATSAAQPPPAAQASAPDAKATGSGGNQGQAAAPAPAQETAAAGTSAAAAAPVAGQTGGAVNSAAAPDATAGADRQRPDGSKTSAPTEAREGSAQKTGAPDEQKGGSDTKGTAAASGSPQTAGGAASSIAAVSGSVPTTLATLTSGAGVATGLNRDPLAQVTDSPGNTGAGGSSSATGTNPNERPSSETSLPAAKLTQPEKGMSPAVEGIAITLGILGALGLLVLLILMVRKHQRKSRRAHSPINFDPTALGPDASSDPEMVESFSSHARFTRSTTTSLFASDRGSNRARPTTTISISSTPSNLVIANPDLPSPMGFPNLTANSNNNSNSKNFLDPPPTAGLRIHSPKGSTSSSTGLLPLDITTSQSKHSPSNSINGGNGRMNQFPKPANPFEDPDLNKAYDMLNGRPRSSTLTSKSGWTRNPFEDPGDERFDPFGSLAEKAERERQKERERQRQR